MGNNSQIFSFGNVKEMSLLNGPCATALNNDYYCKHGPSSGFMELPAVGLNLSDNMLELVKI